MVEMNADNYNKWSSIQEMWAGLGVFLIAVIIAVVLYLSHRDDDNVRLQQIKECSHVTHIQKCVEEFSP